MSRIGIVISRFNQMITQALLDSTLKSLKANGVEDSAISIYWVPGAMEIPLIAKKMAASGSFDAVITLGAVIRGETPHFDYVCEQAAAGVMQASLKTEIPILFGVLTTDTIEQAIVRCSKGAYLAEGALEMIELLKNLPEKSIGLSAS